MPPLDESVEGARCPPPPVYMCRFRDGHPGLQCLVATTTMQLSALSLSYQESTCGSNVCVLLQEKLVGHMLTFIAFAITAVFSMGESFSGTPAL